MTQPDISKALPALVAGEQRLRSLALQHGVTYIIADLGGIRSQSDTARAVRYRQQDYAAAVHANPRVALTPITKWRAIAPYGQSYHNYGAAFDILVTGHPPGVDPYALLGSLAPSVGLRWGGDAGFIAANRVDPPHFQLPITLDQARAAWLGAPGAPTGRQVGVVPAAAAFLILLGIGALIAAARSRGQL